MNTITLVGCRFKCIKLLALIPRPTHKGYLIIRTCHDKEQWRVFGAQCANSTQMKIHQEALPPLGTTGSSRPTSRLRNTLSRGCTARIRRAAAGSTGSLLLTMVHGTIGLRAIVRGFLDSDAACALHEAKGGVEAGFSAAFQISHGFLNHKHWLYHHSQTVACHPFELRSYNPQPLPV